MTETERFLRERWYAQRSIGRLMMDLSLAKRAYEESYNDASLTCDLTKARSSQRSTLSPVEYSAVLVVDHYRAEMESIEKRLAAERRKAAMIEQAVKQAGLDPREEEYVRLRYFENRSVEATAQRLYCSLATCGRIRESALRKIKQRVGLRQET
ncbi:MAG: sigma factor-like helix-turn-helix DNA-binding protein [Burkholderiales bacterium]